MKLIPWERPGNGFFLSSFLIYTFPYLTVWKVVVMVRTKFGNVPLLSWNKTTSERLKWFCPQMSSRMICLKLFECYIVLLYFCPLSVTDWVLWNLLNCSLIIMRDDSLMFTFTLLWSLYVTQCLLNKTSPLIWHRTISV